MISLLDVLLVSLTGAAAVFDVKERRIPNWLIVFALVAGILLNCWQGVAHVWDSCWGFGLGIGVFFVPFALGWVGAGDVKLTGAIGAVLGYAWLPRVMFYSALTGGILAMLSLIRNGISWHAFKDLWTDLPMAVHSRGAAPPRITTKSEMVRTIPYGVAISIGTLIAFYLDPRGEWAGF